MGNTDEAEARRKMVEQIQSHARDTAAWTGRPSLTARVLAAMQRVPRHVFVPCDESQWAYADAARPIGHGQTISQPFIVALMTDMAELEPDSRVLELGTGSGYQSAVLCELVRQVYSIERVPELAEHSGEALARCGYQNVALRCGDGALGWPEHAPFDAILVTAATEKTPPALIDQLASGGRMLIPLGPIRESQMLTRIRKDAGGAITEEALLPVAFVPLRSDG